MCDNAGDWPFDVTELSAPDGSITAKFVSFGATLTELLVKDRNDGIRDVVLGYDDPSRLSTDPDHPVFNPIVGRYANRMKNGRFSIPGSKDPQPGGPNVYQIDVVDGKNALHGGTHGWDRRNWTIVNATKTSVTYKHIDAGHEGFPGNVTAFVAYSVEEGGILKATIRATATEKTPIMLTQHNYWNLDAFQEHSPDILSHHLRIDASRIIEVDDSSMPTGPFLDVEGTVYDFRSERLIGSKWNDIPGSRGYNNCWILDSDAASIPCVSLWSEHSGIKLDITTNQPVALVYTGHYLNTPRKTAHGGPSQNYTKYTAVAIEQQGYVDAINMPEWDIDQIYHPGKDYEWNSTYKFTVLK